jgi:hypothetical protein
MMSHDVAIFSVIYLISGLLGGIVRIFFDRRIGPRKAVGYIVVGAIAGNFFVKPILLIMNYSAVSLVSFAPQFLDFVKALPPEVIALLVGMGGIEYCRWINQFLQRRLKKQFERTKNE